MSGDLLFTPQGAQSPLCARLQQLYAGLAARGLLAREADEPARTLHPEVQRLLEQLGDLASLAVDVGPLEPRRGEDEPQRGHWMRSAEALDRACLAVLDGPEEPEGQAAIEQLELFVVHAIPGPDRGAGLDRFASYRSFHDAPLRWGIEIDLDAIAAAARGGLAWAEATTVFAALLASVLHHQWHHVVEDVFVAECELQCGVPLAAAASRALAQRASRRVNEALAQAEAWSRTARHRTRLAARFGEPVLRSIAAAFAGPPPYRAFPRFVRSCDASRRRCAGAVQAWLRFADCGPAEAADAAAFLALRDGEVGVLSDAVPVRIVTASPTVLPALDALV